MVVEIAGGSHQEGVFLVRLQHQVKAAVGADGHLTVAAVGPYNAQLGPFGEDFLVGRSDRATQEGPYHRECKSVDVFVASWIVSGTGKETCLAVTVKGDAKVIGT